MKYLVDANVLGESMKSTPSHRVVSWLRENERGLAVDPVILGEVRFGIIVLPAGKRRRQLEGWFNLVVANIRCLDWDASTGLRWAELVADLRRAGFAMSVTDSMIAATALVHRLTVATHNQKDFRKAGVKIVDPFD